MEVKRKNSRKRAAILAALAAVTEHPTAEMLYNRLKPRYPELSLGLRVLYSISAVGCSVVARRAASIASGLRLFFLTVSMLFLLSNQ